MQFNRIDEIVKYYKSSIDEYFIVQYESENTIGDICRKYYSLPDIHSFIEYSETYPIPRFHELIFEKSPRKFFLDIDYKYAINDIDQYNTLKADFDAHINDIKILMINIFNTTYVYYDIDMDDILTVVSHVDINDYLSNKSNNSKYKFSINLIIDKYLFPDQHEFVGFGKLLLSEYELHVNTSEHIIDTNFFRNASRTFIQNRIIFNTKCGETRYKYPLINGVISTDKSLYHKYILQHRYTFDGKPATIINGVIKIDEFIYKKINISQADLGDILNNTRDHWAGFTPRDINGSRITFDKNHGSIYCQFCKENHSKDNFLYFTIDSYGNVYKRCHQNRTGYEIIYNIVVADDPNNKPNDRRVNRIYNGNSDGDDKSLLWLKPLKLINANVIIDSGKSISRDAFTDSRVLLIKAEMKMGKSKALIEHLMESCPKTIVFISFRRTFSAEAKAKYAKLGFKSYSDSDVPHEIKLTEVNKIIIQVESLHRLVYPFRDLDLVILDEIESIWSQFNSGNFNDFYGAFNTFELLLQSTKQLIAMDANMSSRTARLIERIYDGSSINVYINRFNPNANVKYFVTEKYEWLAKLNIVINEGNNVAIFTNSLKEAKTVRLYLLQFIKDDEICMYNGKTRESIKTEHFSNVNHFWKQYRCIICTPTVSAGVSFEEKHFQYVFGSFTSLSCNVETCRQMLGRVRDIGNNEIYLTLSGDKCKYLTDIVEIKKSLAFNRRELLHETNVLGLINFRVDYSTGESLYTDSLELNIILENIVFDNYSRNDFFNRMINQISGKSNGLSNKSDVVLGIKIDRGILIRIEAQYKTFKDSARTTDIQNIINAKDINDDDYMRIIDKSRSMVDIIPEEHHAMDKYKIIKAIALPPSDLNRPIVKQFSNTRNIDALRVNRQLFADISWKQSIILSNSRDKDKYDKTNNKSKNLIVSSGVIHSVFKEILDITGVNILKICTISDALVIDKLDNDDTKHQLHPLIINLLPMIDLPYDDYFNITTDPCIPSDICYCVTILNMLKRYYKFVTTESNSISYKIKGMKNVIYEHNGIKYLNGCCMKKEKILPTITINYQI